MGHQVELCDLSAEMLALARSQIAEKGWKTEFVSSIAPFRILKHT